MRYNINDRVVVVSSNENKIILDCEIILGTEIYYMTDKTSYSVSQLTDYYEFSDNNEELLKEIINSPGLKEITDSKIEEFANNAVKWYEDNSTTPNKQEIKPKKWFNWFNF